MGKIYQISVRDCAEIDCFVHITRCIMMLSQVNTVSSYSRYSKGCDDLH